MKTIAIWNQKGGVGKTSTAINLAYQLAANPEQINKSDYKVIRPKEYKGITGGTRAEGKIKTAGGGHGKRVLIIDADPQGNATVNLGVNPENLTTLYITLTKGHIMPYETIYDNIAIIPSDNELSNAEQELVSVEGRETKLKEIIKTISEAELFDYCIIDCPANLGLLAINALYAADYLIAPYEPTYFATQGIRSIVEAYNCIKQNANEDLELKILISKYKPKSMIQNTAVNELKKALGPNVLETKIRRSDTIEAAQMKQKPLGAHVKRYNAYEDYSQLAKEIIKL